MVFLCDEPSCDPLCCCSSLALRAGGEDDQLDVVLLKDTHKSINRKTRVRLSCLDFGHPHQPLEHEHGAWCLVPEAAAAIGEPAAAVLGEQVLGNLVD